MLLAFDPTNIVIMIRVESKLRPYGRFAYSSKTFNNDEANCRVGKGSRKLFKIFFSTDTVLSHSLQRRQSRKKSSSYWRVRSWKITRNSLFFFRESWQKISPPFGDAATVGVIFSLEFKLFA